MDFMDKWGKFILRYVVAVMVVAILVVGGLIVRQIFFTPENTTPRTAAERTLMDAEETVKANPRDAKARAELARAYILIGRYNDAIDQAKIGIKLDPKNAQAFYYLGLADKNKGDNAEAMKNFTEAAKIQGTMADFKSDVYYQMGEVLMSQQKYADAAGYYSQAVNNDPNGDANILYALGVAYEKSGNKQLAIDTYKEVMKYLPNDSRPVEALKRLKAIQ